MPYDDHWEEMYQQTKESDSKQPTIVTNIKRFRILLSESALDVFEIELTGKDGVWYEAVGSESELRTFMRGVEAGAGLLGDYLKRPEIPEQAARKVQVEDPPSED